MVSEFQGVYRQLYELMGSANPVKELLRQIKDRSAQSSIQLGGNKDDLVRNLRRAVSDGVASVDEVQKLLWDIEEVGRQHILLLRPAPLTLAEGKESVIEDSGLVAERLFEDIKISEIFPRYEYPSNGWMWSDFREEGNGSWLAKAYGVELYRQSQGLVSTEEQSDGTIQEIRQYVWKETKTTLIAKWRAYCKILELRIDITGIQNEKTIDERRAAFWKLLHPAFSPGDLIGLDVDPLLKRIIFDRDLDHNRSSYSISRVELTDPRSGQIRVIPNQSEELDKDPGRRASLDAMMANNFLPSLVRVEWKHNLPECPGSMTEPVSVVIEKTKNGPEIRLLKRISNDTYEYIFDQLRSRL